MALATWTQALLKPAGVTTTQAGIVLVVNVIAGVAGCALIPVWATRHGRELGAMRVAVLVTAAACLALSISGRLPVAVVAYAAFGFVLLAALPIVLEFTERYAGEHAATAAGLIWLSGNLGGLVFAGIVGVVVHHPSAAFVLLAVITVAALPLLRRLQRSIPVIAAPIE